MTINKYIRTAAAIVLAAISTLTPFDARATLEGEWQYITSFNALSTVSNTTNPNHCRKIIDGPRYTYFLVHSRSYRRYMPAAGTDVGIYATPAPVLFRADNSQTANPEGNAEIIPLADLPGACGTIVCDAAYNGKAEALVVAYADGTIGIYSDNGEIREVSDFRFMNIPGSKKINTVTFDPDGKRAYLAGIFGYLTLDVEHARIADICLTPSELAFAFRVGNRMIVADQFRIEADNNKKDVVILGKTYVAPLKNSNLWSDFSPIAVDEASSIFPADATQKGYIVEAGLLKSPVQAMPLNDNTAIIVTNTSNKRQLSVISPLQDGSWATVYLEDQEIPSFQLLVTQDILGEGYICPTADGWGFFWQKNFVSYDASQSLDFSKTDIAGDYKNRARHHIEMSTYGPTLNKGLRGGCYNLQDAWLFEPFKGWERMHYDPATSQWSFLFQPTLPNAPTLSATNHIAFNPERGLLVTQFNKKGVLTTGSIVEPTYINQRHNGQWSELTPTSESADLKTPLGNGSEIAIDPVHSEYIYYGTGSGLVRRNLQDPTDLLVIGSSGVNAAVRNLPGFIEGFPLQNGWKARAEVQAPVFDEEGNLWFVFRYFDTNDIWICKWERAAIDASLQANADKSKYVPFKHLFFDTVNSNNQNIAYPCGTADGKDIVIVAALEEPHNIHVGEIDWTKAEPEYTNIYDGPWLNSDGDELESYMPNGILKSPIGDEVWLMSDSGLKIINPRKFRNGEISYDQVIPGISAAEAHHAFPNSAIIVYCGTSDSYGRMWFGTDAGLFCYTPDGKELLGRWSVDNTPLKEKAINGICWDDETRSLVLSNLEGLWEFTPYQNSPVASADAIRIWPTAVEPSFNGFVTLSGVPDGTSLAVVDKTGCQVSELSAPFEGTAQWDLKIQGRRAPSGIYSIIIPGQEKTLGKVTLY